MCVCVCVCICICIYTYTNVEKIANGLFSLISCVRFHKFYTLAQEKVGQDDWRTINDRSLAVYGAKKIVTVNY